MVAIQSRAVVPHGSIRCVPRADSHQSMLSVEETIKLAVGLSLGSSASSTTEEKAASHLLELFGLVRLKDTLVGSSWASSHGNGQSRISGGEVRYMVAMCFCLGLAAFSTGSTPMHTADASCLHNIPIVSSPQARRLSIAEAICTPMTAMLLDEPTNGLDAAWALRTVELLGQLAR